MQDTKRLYAIPEAADQLGISRAKLYAMIAGGEIKALKIGRRTLIAFEDLDAFVEYLKGQAE